MPESYAIPQANGKGQSIELVVTPDRKQSDPDLVLLRAIRDALVANAQATAALAAEMHALRIEHDRASKGISADLRATATATARATDAIAGQVADALDSLGTAVAAIDVKPNVTVSPFIDIVWPKETEVIVRERDFNQNIVRIEKVYEGNVDNIEVKVRNG